MGIVTLDHTSAKQASEITKCLGIICEIEKYENNIKKRPFFALAFRKGTCIVVITFCAGVFNPLEPSGYYIFHIL
jgi:hypothetical protein